MIQQSLESFKPKIIFTEPKPIHCEYYRMPPKTKTINSDGYFSLAVAMFLNIFFLYQTVAESHFYAVMLLPLIPFSILVWNTRGYNGEE